MLAKFKSKYAKVEILEGRKFIISTEVKKKRKKNMMNRKNKIKLKNNSTQNVITIM